ncbi:MAG: DUF2162 domain-containing protein [Deltaproteobacteria bacterium]|nr:DUF2162 domain-containing protein [Deltaproteobacteria bacterium]
MELKSLILGLFFSIGIFGIKSGIGLQYFFHQQKKLIGKIVFFLLFASVYFCVFMVCAQVLNRIDILRYFEMMQTFFKSGMFIHIMMAGLMTIWGIRLLKKDDHSDQASYGWAVLAVPCPVCITVIFFTVAFLLSCFPDAGNAAVLSAYAGFVGINLLTVILMGFWQSRSKSTPESILGTAMLIIAAYFFLSVIIMPQFGDLDKIYRMAQYKGENRMMDIKHTVSLYVLIAASFNVGFLLMRRKTGRSSIKVV